MSILSGTNAHICILRFYHKDSTPTIFAAGGRVSTSQLASKLQSTGKTESSRLYWAAEIGNPEVLEHVTDEVKLDPIGYMQVCG